MCWGTLPALGISYVLCPLGASGGHGWVINHGHLGFCKCTPWCLLNDQMTQWCNFQTVSLSLSNCGWNTDQLQRVNVGTTLLTVALLTDIFFLARDPVPDPPWHQTVGYPLWSWDMLSILFSCDLDSFEEWLRVLGRMTFYLGCSANVSWLHSGCIVFGS